MDKILITGGAGFIGFHLARSLAVDKQAVDLLDDFSRGMNDDDLKTLVEQPNVTLRSLNLQDQQAASALPDDYSHIFHFAARLGVEFVRAHPYSVLSDNHRLLENAIAIARRQKQLQRFVFTSTSEVYAGTLQAFGLKFPTPEETPLTIGPLEEPRTSYMLSKIYGEALCTHSGVPFTIVRPHNFYGPRMGLNHVIPELLKKAHCAADGHSIDVPSVEHCRTFCYIDDAVELLRKVAATEKAAGRTINAGVDKPEHTIAEVAETVFRVTGKRLAINALPATPGSPPRRSPDISLAKRLIGFSPRVALEDGVRRTYEWYRRKF